MKLKIPVFVSLLETKCLSYQKLGLETIFYKMNHLMPLELEVLIDPVNLKVKQFPQF